ncbi:MAG: phosphohydrolase [Flavobacteriales bacterium]|jgi:(p)ppGpp synthase/HD superfamily hydrolase|nr:phosphohydrolase [Flavobacteriales bacterium]
MQKNPSAEDAGLLERAVRLATKAHKGQTDRFGQPYILHVLRVISAARDPEERLLAALHDVLERSDITMAQLRDKGFPEPVLAALAHITKRPDEVYEAYIDRVAKDPLAVRVKVLDLADKMDLRDVGELSVSDVRRYNRQLAAYERLRHMAAVIRAEMTLGRAALAKRTRSKPA